MNKFIRIINQQICRLLTIALVLTGVPIELFAAPKTVSTINKAKTGSAQKLVESNKNLLVPTPKPVNSKTAKTVTPKAPIAPTKTVTPKTPAKTATKPAPQKSLGLKDVTPQIIPDCIGYSAIASCSFADCAACDERGAISTNDDWCSIAVCLYPQNLASQLTAYTTIKQYSGNFQNEVTTLTQTATGQLQDQINSSVCGTTSSGAINLKQIMDYWTALQWAQNQLVNMQVKANGTATWQQDLPNSALAINNYYVTKGQVDTNQCLKDADCADSTITTYQDCVPVSGNAQNALGVDNSCIGGSISKGIWGTCNYTGTACQTDNFCNQQKVCKFPDGRLCNSKADCLPGSQDLFCNTTNSCFNNQCTLTGKTCTTDTDCPALAKSNGICMSKVGTQCYSVAQNSCSSNTSTAGFCSIDGKICSTSTPCAVITSNTCSTENTCIGTTCSISGDTCSTVAPIATCPNNTNINTCSSTNTTPGFCAIDKQLCCNVTGCPDTAIDNKCSSTTSTPGTCAIDGLACSINTPCATNVASSCAQSGICNLTGNNCTTNKTCPDSGGVPQCTLSTNGGVNPAVLNSDLVCTPINFFNPNPDQQVCTLRHAGLTECFAASPSTTDYFDCGITGGLACQPNPDYPTENICLLGLDTANGPTTPAITDTTYGCIALSGSKTANNPIACDNFGLVNNANAAGIVNQSSEPFLTSKIANAKPSATYIPSLDVTAFTNAWQAMQINVNITAASQSPYSPLNPYGPGAALAPQLTNPVQCGIAPGMSDDNDFYKMTILCNAGSGLSTLVNQVAAAANFLNPVMYPEITYNADIAQQNCAAQPATGPGEVTNGSQCPFVYPNNSAYYYDTSVVCNLHDLCTSGGTCSLSSNQFCLYNPTGTIACDNVGNSCIFNSNSGTSTNTGTCSMGGVVQTNMMCCNAADCTCGNTYCANTGDNPQACVPTSTCAGATAPCTASDQNGTCRDKNGNQSAGIPCCIDADCNCATQVQLCPADAPNLPASCQAVGNDGCASPFAYLAGLGATPGVYINCLLPAQTNLGISPAHPVGGPCPTGCQTSGTYCDTSNSTECSLNTLQAQTCSALGNCSVTTATTCLKDSDCPTTETCLSNDGMCSKSGAKCISNSGCPLGQTCDGTCSITQVTCHPESAATDCPSAYSGIDPTNGAAGTIIMTGSCVGQSCSTPPGFGSPYNAITNPGGISDAGPNNTLCCNGTYCCQDASCGKPGYCVYNSPGLACPGIAGDPADCIPADGTSETGTTGTVTCKTKSAGICNCNDIVCTDDNDCTVSYTPNGASTALTYTCLNSSCYNPSGNQGGGICQPNGPSLSNTTPNSNGIGLYDATYNAICAQVDHAGMSLLTGYYNNDLNVAMRYAQATKKLYQIVNSNTAITKSTPYNATDATGAQVTCKITGGGTGTGFACEPLNLYLKAPPSGIVDGSGNILNMAAYVATLQVGIMTLLGTTTSPFDGAFTASQGYLNVVTAITATCPTKTSTTNPCLTAAINDLGLVANVGKTYYLPLVDVETNYQNDPNSLGLQMPVATITPGAPYLTVAPTTTTHDNLPTDSPLLLGKLNVPENVTSANVFLNQNNCLNACCNADPSDTTCFPNGFNPADNDVYCSCTLFSNLIAPYDTIPLSDTGTITSTTLYEYFNDALTAVNSTQPSSYTIVTNWNENAAAISTALTYAIADYQILAAADALVRSIGTPEGNCTAVPPESPAPPLTLTAILWQIWGVVSSLVTTAIFIKMSHPSVKKTPEEKLKEAEDAVKDAKVKRDNLEIRFKADPGLSLRVKTYQAKKAFGKAVKRKAELDLKNARAKLEKQGLDPDKASIQAAETAAPGSDTSNPSDVTHPTPEQIATIEAHIRASIEDPTLQRILNAGQLEESELGPAKDLISNIAKDLETTDTKVRDYLKERAEINIDRVDWTDFKI